MKEIQVEAVQESKMRITMGIELIHKVAIIVGQSRSQWTID
jgi:hypothetical protein